MRNRSVSFLVLWTILTFVPTLGHDSLLHAEEALRPRVDRLVQPYLDSKIVQGMTIGVLHNGQKEFFGYGRVNDVDTRLPDKDTIYEIGSVTKVFTGVLLADAVLAGRVKLDQPAGELLPSGVLMPTHEKREITLQDLSTHVSGLPALPDNLTPRDMNNPYVDYTMKDLHAFLGKYKLSRAPGERSEYSNLAQGLLGHLLANEQRTTYEELFRRRIAIPLQMTDTTITLGKEQQARFATPHLADGQPAFNWDLPTFAGAGALRSSASDMLRFAEANLIPPESDLGRAIELAWKVHQKPLTKGAFAMGLGWHVAHDGSTRWHNGQTGGFHTMLLVNRDIQKSVVLLTNTSTLEVDKLAEDILQMLTGAKVEPRTFENGIEVSADVMNKYVGKYELAPKFIFTVTVEDGKLMVDLTGQPTFQVFARSETEWFYKVVKATLTFHLDNQGKCDSVELFQNGIRQKAKRIE